MRRLASGTLLCLSLAGCPVPEVTAPDFTPVGVADLGQSPDLLTRDLGGGDMLTAPSWRSESPAGVPAALRGVWQTATDTYVVGDSGTILRRGADNTWKPETAPKVNNVLPDLYGVVGLASNDLLAVGSGGAVLRRSAATGMWAVETVMAASATLYGVTALSGGDLIAVGDKGLVVVYSAGAWTAETTPVALDQLSLRAVAAKGAEVYAVGSYNAMAGTTGVILRRGVGSWAEDAGMIAAADRVPFYAVATAGSTVYVAGAKAKVLRQDAAGWIAEKTVAPAVPDGGMAPAATDFLALLGAADGTLVAAGTAAGVQWRSAGGTTWAAETAGAGSDLYALAGSWPRALLAVGKSGFVGRRF